jgi:hypothetical protein
MVYFTAERNCVAGMHCKALSACVLCLCLIACQPRGSSEPSSSGAAAAVGCQYVVSGGIPNPGPQPLLSGDTIASVLARNVYIPPGQPITIVLIRHAPEGKTRQLIQLDSRGQLMDEKQNFALRNGDELVFPGGKGSDSSGNPTGQPQRGRG